MADDSASFTFVTPEARRERPLGFESGVESDDWHFRNGPSPIAPRFVDQEQEETKHEEWAHTHFRRRNRLETRLEELQKDVASLTLKLRANPNRSTSLDASSFLLTQADKSLDGNLSVQSKKVDSGEDEKGASIWKAYWQPGQYCADTT
ncbi:hypothetical protein PHYBOEH_011140 [Phytophthora boehmeriae]|uniref:Uncharacterized protein n=1 Tax=Phytophthora boehmeriae TaxID=109152 RepID=A0A8T1X1S4_9STRA|nr:hypothetical protein PHYBOEH_011140 [Phytophthora boehmeriae]